MPKRLKPNTDIWRVVNLDGSITIIYADSRTGETRRRWWTRARTPGEVRSTRLPGGPGYHPVKYGSKQRGIIERRARETS